MPVMFSIGPTPPRDESCSTALLIVVTIYPKAVPTQAKLTSPLHLRTQWASRLANETTGHSEMHP
jgi:hypothetical protein